MMLHPRSFAEIVADIKKDPDGELAEHFVSYLRQMRPDWATKTKAELIAMAVALARRAPERTGEN